MFDNHQAGGGYVDPDLDHGGRDQDADLARLETRHDVVLFGTLHPAVDEPDAAGAQSFAQQCRAVFGCREFAPFALGDERADPISLRAGRQMAVEAAHDLVEPVDRDDRSEEHTSELQSLMRISYAVFCLKKKHTQTNIAPHTSKHKTRD